VTLPEPRPPAVGPLIVVVGGIVVLIGLLVWSGALAWFGRLPGDVRYESGSTRIYIPWVSMLLISLVLSALGVAIRRLF
jgi:hypothetical protein